MQANPIVKALALLALASCASPSRDTTSERVVTCNADNFAYLQGEPIEVVDTLQTALQVRVLGPDDFVPRDFDPNRLTFTETPEGEVSRVFCG